MQENTNSLKLGDILKIGCLGWFKNGLAKQMLDYLTFIQNMIYLNY